MHLYEQAATWIKEAQAIYVGTGAGMGVDSGLPDFRGNEGFWNAYPPYKKLGMGFSQMADPDWFRKDPSIAWGFYGHRLNLYRETIPHPGFQYLLDWASSKPYGYFVFTSNVDGQFQKAGFNADRIMEVHGSIHHFQCTKPCSDVIWEADFEYIEVDMETMRAAKPYPSCLNCGALARPNILMFGDRTWLGTRSDEQSYRLDHWLHSMKKDRIVIIEIGAGPTIPTVRWHSETIAMNYNAAFIRINPQYPEISERISEKVEIAAGGLEALEKIQVVLDTY